MGIRLMKVDDAAYVNTGDGNVTSVIAIGEDVTQISFTSGRSLQVMGGLEGVVRRLTGAISWGADR